MSISDRISQAESTKAEIKQYLKDHSQHVSREQLLIHRRRLNAVNLQLRNLRKLLAKDPEKI